MFPSPDEDKDATYLVELWWGSKESTGLDTRECMVQMDGGHWYHYKKPCSLRNKQDIAVEVAEKGKHLAIPPFMPGTSICNSLLTYWFPHLYLPTSTPAFPETHSFSTITSLTDNRNQIKYLLDLWLLSVHADLSSIFVCLLKTSVRKREDKKREGERAEEL